MNKELITNLHRSVHDDVTSTRTRLHGVVELLEQAQVNGTDTDEFTAAVADLRAVEQRLAELAHR